MQTVSIVEEKYLSICELLRNTKQYLGKNSKMQSIRFSWECSVDGAPGFSGGAEAAVYNFFPGNGLQRKPLSEKIFFTE